MGSKTIASRIIRIITPLPPPPTISPWIIASRIITLRIITLGQLTLRKIARGTITTQDNYPQTIAPGQLMPG